MNEIFAIPIESGVLCSHFGHCSLFSIIHIENNKVAATKFLVPPVHEPGVLPNWLAEQGVTEVIAAGIGQSAINLLNKKNIHVTIGAPLKSPQELVTDKLNNTLTTSENVCNH
ncbi:MAG: ATPase [Paludibacteraceae bacterium]|nr:ATPase [Paludibacteraceae bacterium]